MSAIPNNNPFTKLFDDLKATSSTTMSNSLYAHHHFLNPQIPYAVSDDPDGKIHFDMGISDKEGNPIPGIKKDDPIPLTMRNYQTDILDNRMKYKVLRMGRRTGKSFTVAVDMCTTALRDGSAKLLVLTPNESHIKIMFDDYVRPLFASYRHRKSGRIGIPTDNNGTVPPDCDFVIVTDTKKPQEIRITDGKNHNVTIRGMVIGTAARGQSASKVYFDEADWANTDDVRAVVAPIILTRPTTQILMSSTPTGRRDSFYYEACQDQITWKQYHFTFEVLPHFTEEVRKRMIAFAGGEDTNAYQQEYLAEFGGQMEGVFDQKALNKSFIVSPYVNVLERVDEDTRDRKPLLADAHTDLSQRRLAYYEGVQPQDWRAANHTIGSESVYRPEYRGHGIVTAGTDWNSIAGMQTVLIWWPPELWLRDGRLKVSQFDYDKDEPITTGRAKNERGHPQVYTIGSTNGEPGNPHDLSHVKGIVIWHGRLESGQFSWQSAANRVIGMLAIPDFIDTWYVDAGYGEQINKMIEGIMNSGQYIADLNHLHKAMDIDEKMLRNIRRFHPDSDPERTGKLYRTVRFGDPYPHTDIDYKKRKDRYKDVMVGVTKRMVAGREILFPFGELVGFYGKSDLGQHYTEEVDMRSGEVREVGESEYDQDRIELNGADPARGESTFGGLVTQMREWRVEAYSSATGQPRYAGADHAIDGLLLASLAWWENHSQSNESNIFNPERSTTADLAEVVWAGINVDKTPPPSPSKRPRQRHGAFDHTNYSNERDGLKLLQDGTAPEAVGTTLEQMIRQAGHQARRRKPPSRNT